MHCVQVGHSRSARGKNHPADVFLLDLLRGARATARNTAQQIAYPANHIVLIWEGQAWSTWTSGD